MAAIEDEHLAALGHVVQQVGQLELTQPLAHQAAVGRGLEAPSSSLFSGSFEAATFPPRPLRAPEAKAELSMVMGPSETISGRLPEP